MKKSIKNKLLAASAVALISTGGVHAADVVQSYDPPEVAPEVVSAPAFNWEGGYIGAQIGGAWADSSVSSYFHAGTFPAGLVDGSLDKWSPDPSGFIGGLYAGWNFDIGNPSEFVVGVETDFVFGSLDKTTDYSLFDLTATGIPTAIPSADFLNARAHIDQKWAGATRVRIAYAADRFLPYITAGIAYAKIDSRVDGWIEDTGGVKFAGTDFDIKNSDTFTGWTIGAGTDYAATDNLLLRFEYRYSDYGDKTYHYNLAFGTGNAVSYKVDHKTHDLRVGIAYKF